MPRGNDLDRLLFHLGSCDLDHRVDRDLLLGQQPREESRQRAITLVGSRIGSSGEHVTDEVPEVGGGHLRHVEAVALLLQEVGQLDDGQRIRLRCAGRQVPGSKVDHPRSERVLQVHGYQSGTQKPVAYRSALRILDNGEDETPGQRVLRPRQDSNLRSRFRRPVLYPLSYGGGYLGSVEAVPLLASSP